MLNQVGTLAGAAAKLITRDTRAVAERILRTAENSTSGMRVILESAAKKITPTVIRVRAIPAGLEPDQYALVVDDQAFITALNDGKLTRPQIEIIATTDQIDRTILTDRLIIAFDPLLQTIQRDIAIIIQSKQQSRDGHKTAAVWSEFYVLLDMILLTIMSGGVFLLIMVGLAGIQFITELPQLLMKKIKTHFGLSVFDTQEDAEIAALTQKLAYDRELLERIVREATITVDPSLSL